ncbi:MAG: protein kinase [Deltaproteobacteria bacterium]|nr:protein kinase [Deltaproteobacteria bacterium]
MTAAGSQKDDLDATRDAAAEQTSSDDETFVSGVRPGLSSVLAGQAANETAAIPLVAPVHKTVGNRGRASIALSGLHATSPEALRRRLIGPWAEGLRQYLTLQLGDQRRGAAAFTELKRLVLATPTSELIREPGAKAHVYRLARRIALEKLRAGPPSPRRDVPHRIADVHASAVEILRSKLDAKHAEILELRFARELLPLELACVLGTHEGSWDDPSTVDLAPIEHRLNAALAAARTLIAPSASDSTRRAIERREESEIFVATFALQPQRDEASVRESDGRGLEPGTSIGGRYRLLSRVGVGAFGDVYKADDQDVPGHRVALKLLREPALSQSARDEALRELKLIAAVFHPSVVLFKDHGWFEDRLWFVMPWYEGVTLDKRVRETGGITRAEARSIFEPLARALATLHANGIRHQDIKPDNVLLARIRGFVRGIDGSSEVLPILIDLGVAAKEHEALIGGTPVYFAPEVAGHYAQREESREVGPAADVFALALSLRNALEPETEEDVPAGAIEAFIERRAEEPPSPPTRKDLRYLRGSFDRWLNADPSKRPTAEELVRELAILTEPEKTKKLRRRTMSWLAPLLMALAAVFGAVIWVYQRNTDLQRREIRAAHQEIAAARADLLVEASRRQALDSDHAELLRRYEAESLSSEELANQLATAQSQIDILGRQLATSLSARDDLTAEREALNERVTSAETSARQLGLTVAHETARSEELEARLRRVRDERQHERDELTAEIASARERAERASSDLAAARDERDRHAERVRELETRLSSDDGDRAELEARIARLRERVSSLRDRVRQTRQAPRDTTTPSEEESAAPPEHEAPASDRPTVDEGALFEAPVGDMQ